MSGATPARLNAALEGRYRIERELGEGGMATVYLAEDVRHDRNVALKVLKPELAAVVGAERFLAEIKTTAQLQHPHILPLHDSGEADGFLFYVMPYIEGESLRERLERERQLPVDEAVQIARDVADALDYAHRQGVVHRDIKPANILLHEGRPQLADFGIALAVSEAGEGRLTETGLSMGTPHYMSPEQAAGERTVDARTDVYALGCVLYEMLAGQPPFPGASAQAVLARILTTDPAPVTAARRSVPPNVEAAVARALEKLPADRFSSAKAFREALDDPSFRHTVRPSGTGADGSVATGATGPVSATTVSRGRAWLMVAVAVVAALAAGWFFGSNGATPPAPGPVLRVPVAMGALELNSRTKGIALSPDGRTMAVAARAGDGPLAIHVRRSDEATFRVLPETGGGSHPAFSPDGAWLVFRSEEGGLRKVALAGGSPTTVVAASLDVDPFRPHWGDDGMIVFAGSEGLYEVSENGGDPTHLVKGEPGDIFRPWRLPGGRGIVGAGVGGEGVWLYDPSVDSLRTIVPDGQYPAYLEPGYLAYRHLEGGLWVVPFDLEALELTGSARPILDHVTGPYSVSDNGTLVYSTGTMLNADRILLVRVPLDGGPLDTLPPAPRAMHAGTFSPDASKIAFVVDEERRSDIFIYDMVLGGPTRFTFSRSSNSDPVWSPDGTRIAFSTRDSSFEGTRVYVKPLDGSARAVPFIEEGHSVRLNDWTPDGLLLYSTGVPDGDIRMRPVGDEAADEPVLAAEWTEAHPKLSPGGAWLAYTSRESGRAEVYVRRFPDLTGQQRVSEGGGQDPHWSPEGDVLYYEGAGAEVVAARLRLEPVLAVLERDVVYRGPVLSYDVHPTEPVLLVMTSVPGGLRAGGSNESQWFIVANWFTELRERLGEARE